MEEIIDTTPLPRISEVLPSKIMVKDSITVGLYYSGSSRLIIMRGNYPDLDYIRIVFTGVSEAESQRIVNLFDDITNEQGID